MNYMKHSIFDNYITDRVDRNKDVHQAFLFRAVKAKPPTTFLAHAQDAAYLSNILVKVMHQ